MNCHVEFVTYQNTKLSLLVRTAIDADADAKALFGDYLAFQQEIHGVIQSGQMPTEDQQKKMQDFAEKLQGNPIVNEFFTKQQQLSVYLGDIEQIICGPVQDLFK